MLHYQLKLTTIALVSIYITATGCSSHSSNNNQVPIDDSPPIVIENLTDKSYKQRALIVGVQDYAGENGANDLIGIDKDTKNMEKLFKGWGFETTILENSFNFEQMMIDYGRDLTKDDVFILYYSGHGSSVNDKNGDEADNKDELIVLSDTYTNRFYLDDKIETLLSNIEAKKLIIFDSCNSGTSHKEYGVTTKVKYIPVPENYVLDTTIKKKFIRKTTKEGPYIFFAACQDNEQSIASTAGSLFTNSFIKKVTLDKSVSQVLADTSQDLNSQYARFSPNLTSSSDVLESANLREYLKIVP